MEVTAGIFVKDHHILLMRRAQAKVQLAVGNILGEK